MGADDEVGDNATPGSTPPDEPDPLESLMKVLEVTLQIAVVYFHYKHDEAATALVTALIYIVQVFRR